MSASYDNIIVLGDFNVEPEEAKMSEFLNIYSLKNLKNILLTEFLKYWCFLNKTVRFSQTYIHNPETKLSKTKS